MSVSQFNEEKGLKWVDSKMGVFLKEMVNEGKYTPLNKNESVSIDSARNEYKDFVTSDLKGKIDAMMKYTQAYKDIDLTPNQREILETMNTTVMLSIFTSNGVPVDIVKEEELARKNSKEEKITMEDIKKQQEKVLGAKKDCYKEAMDYISALRDMKNIEKCDFHGTPMPDFMFQIQIKETCSEKQLNVLKKTMEELHRYNQALAMISQMELKKNLPLFKREPSYKIAQTLKEGSKARCSERQFYAINETYRRMLGDKRPTQLSLFSPECNTNSEKSNKNRNDDFSR